MAKDVRCSVRGCHYWADGNRCEAENIDVGEDYESPAASPGRARMEVGSIGDAGCCGPGVARGRSFEGPQASRSPQTQCRTFKPRER